MAADSPIQFRAIVYCPPNNLENLGFARLDHGLSLCAKRVLVQSDCRELLPEYLRFLRGLVDSEDLPLNVSRETLQDNSVIRKMRTSIVKGVLDRLDRLAQDEPELYRKFYDQFGRVLKEGLIVDHANHERIAKLLRFASSRSDDPKSLVSFDAYIEKMPEQQTQIYYQAGSDFSSIKKSPNLEIFRRNGIEVIYMTDPVDEFAIKSLGTYREKKLTSIDSADIDIPNSSTFERRRAKAATHGAKESGFPKVLELFREALGARISEVRESKRLIDSPCCLVNVEGGMSTQMQRLLKMANKEFTESARILEVNPSAPLIRRLCNLSANNQHHSFIKQCGLQLWSDAMILDGVTPEPEDLVARDAVVHDRGRREAIAADSLTSQANTGTVLRVAVEGPSRWVRDNCPRWPIVFSSAAVQPVEVERERVRTGSRGDRVEVVDRHIASHRVVRPDRAERVGQTLEEPGGTEPRPARGIDRVLARHAVEVRIDALGVGRLHSQTVKPLRADPVRVFDPSVVRIAGVVEKVAMRVRRQQLRSSTQTASAARCVR